MLAQYGAAQRLTHDEAYWAHFAEAAGWQRHDSGMWRRPANRNEVPDFAWDGGAEITAPTAFAACQLDGLGSQRDKTDDDKAAQLTVEGLAEAMRANHGNCTEDVLAALGFPLSFQKQNRDAAVTLANKSFVQQLDTSGDNEEATVAGMREAVGQIMPSLKDVITGLRYRGFSERQINLYTRRVVNLAAKDFVAITQPRVAAGPGQGAQA
ncbi:hypothetical protein [Devosia sp. Root635]|uniref:hypothetical protein n=1 Tax=Devosia sp. Root635 TaxID=1736575 RepID=UPI000B2C6370|nr:hypothetical protein [Devosia sp. Root635]